MRLDEVASPSDAEPIDAEQPGAVSCSSKSFSATESSPVEKTSISEAELAESLHDRYTTSAPTPERNALPVEDSVSSTVAERLSYETGSTNLY